jgi:hypothetical protein
MMKYQYPVNSTLPNCGTRAFSPEGATFPRLVGVVADGRGATIIAAGRLWGFDKLLARPLPV